MSKARKEAIMANKTTTTQQFNVWNYVKKELCKKYLETKKTDFEVSFRIMDDYTNKEGKTYCPVRFLFAEDQVVLKAAVAA